MTLTDVNKGHVHIGGEVCLDHYDFNMDGRILRDFATWIGRPGPANSGKDFTIFGYGHAVIPIRFL